MALQLRQALALVGADLPELLPLMRAHCDLYQVVPGDQALLELILADRWRRRDGPPIVRLPMFPLRAETAFMSAQ